MVGKADASLLISAASGNEADQRLRGNLFGEIAGMGLEHVAGHQRALRTASVPTTITVTAPAGGDLPFFCRLHVHVGMWGGFFPGSGPTATPTPF